MAERNDVSDRVTINVTDLIDKNPVGGFQVRVIILCAFVLFFDGYDIAALSSTVPLLAEHVHVKVSAIAPVFAAGFMGVMIGSLLLGSIADRIGRKGMVVVSTFICGFCTLLTPNVYSLQALIFVRFLTGLGIGGAMPNAIAIVSEYSPTRSRAFLTTAAFTGVPIGGAAAHFLGAYFLKSPWGWQWTFYFGAFLPILLALILIAALPESIRYMVTRGDAAERIARILKKMYGKFSEAETAVLSFRLSEDPRKKKVPLSQLVTEGRAPLTILSWVANFSTLIVGLLIASWYPTVLRANGVPLDIGLKVSALFSVGAVCGTPTLGRLMDRFNPRAVLMCGYIGALLFVSSFGFVGSHLVVLSIVTFCAGFCVYGSQAGVIALAASFYPTALRASGLGWVLGIGRLGSIVGPVAGGMMVARHWPLKDMFLAAAFPALIAGVCVLIMDRLIKGRVRRGEMVEAKVQLVGK